MNTNTNHTRYRVYIQNGHAQTILHDFPAAHTTRGEALEELIAAKFDALDNEVKLAADKIADYDTDTAKWHAACDRIWEARRAEIADHGYDDGNGRRYYIREEDDRAPLYVVRIRSYYGPSESYDIVDGEYLTLADARAVIAESESVRYDLAHNETGRPEYIVIGQAARDWLDDGDPSKFDWDGCACHAADGDACGECDKCAAWMGDQEIAYIRAQAIAEDAK